MITFFPAPSPNQTSAAPTPYHPNGIITQITVGSDGLPQSTSTCRKGLPNSAAGVTNQLIAFDYVTNLVAGANVELAKSSITLRLQQQLVNVYLTCDYSLNSTTTNTIKNQNGFWTYRMSTAPPDVVLTNTPCTSAQKVNNYDCYRIQAAFTATIFYLPFTGRRALGQEKEDEDFLSQSNVEEELSWWVPIESNDHQNHGEEHGREAISRRRRLLNITSTILDSHVYNSFNQSIQTIFASGSLTGPTVKTVTFLGITNDASGEGGGNGGVSAVQRSGNQATIAGSVVGTVAGVAFVVFTFLFVKQYQKRRAKDSERIHPHLDESVSDLSLQLGAAPPPSQAKATGAPELQEQYMPIESEVFDLDTATLDDEDEESRVKQSMGLKMSYETDDEDEESSAAKRDPMFVSVRPDLSDAHALADMKQRIQDEFGASAYQKSRIKRKYTVGDTVAL